MTRWPQGHRSAALITVNLDAELGILASLQYDPSRAKALSVGGYGTRRGAGRVLEALTRHGLTATWFVPLWIARAHPDLIGRLLAAGQDIGNRGERLEDFGELEPVAAAELIARVQDEWAADFGVRPSGLRIGRGQIQPETFGLLTGSGITWSSCWGGDDLPYRHPGSDVIEVPRRHELEDAPHFGFVLDPPMPAALPGVSSPAMVGENWAWEIDAASAEGGLVVLGLSPEWIGTPGRLTLLDEVLTRIAVLEDVWLPSGPELARWWSEHGPINDRRHPVEVFERARPRP